MTKINLKHLLLVIKFHLNCPYFIEYRQGLNKTYSGCLYDISHVTLTTFLRSIEAVCHAGCYEKNSSEIVVSYSAQMVFNKSFRQN